MNGLIAWWARNHVASNLLMIFIIIAGIVTYATALKREALPSITPQSVAITVAWPGASPVDVEEQILLRIEESLAEVDKIKRVEATSSEGSANVTIEKVEDADFDAFLNDIKARVDGISNLPQDSFPPVVRRSNFNNELAWIIVTGDLGEREMNRLARSLREELAAIPGGSPLVSIQSERTEEVSIEVSEIAMRRYGLTFDEVSRAVRAASLNLSMGEIRTDTGNIPLASRNLADTAEDFGDIIVRHNLDGSIIRVRDIANVIDGFPDANFMYRVNGKRGFTIAVSQPLSADIVDIMGNIRGWIDEKQEELPPGVEIELLFTLEQFYNGRLRLVRDNAVQGLILVLIILMLFLRPSVAIWVAAGIGVSFIGTFIFLPIVGVSLNVLSLFGLLLVIGIVVDDALVVGESINRQVEIGRRDLDAAVIGTQIVIKPVVFAVITTMLAFSPFIFIGGMFSPFVESIAWTVILALTFSLIESFLILPSHLAHLGPASDRGVMRFQRYFADGLIWVADRWYRPLVHLAVEFRLVTIALFGGMMALSLSLVIQGWIPFSFEPDIENTFIDTTVNMQEGTSWPRSLQIYEQIERAVTQLDAQLQDETGVDVIESSQTFARTGYINNFTTLAPTDDTGITSSELADRLRDLIGPIPDATEVRMMNDFGMGGSSFSVDVIAQDLDQAAAATREIKNYLRSIPQLFDVRDSLQAPLDELRLKLRPGAERFGVNVQEVSRQLRQAYYGEEVQRLPREGQDVRVMVRYPLETRQSLESLFTGFRIRTSDGREIPVSSVVEFESGPAVRFIRRTDRKRSVTIYARIREGADVGPVRADFYQTVVPEILAKYPKIDIQKRGTDKEQSEFFKSLSLLGGGALLAMYMLLAIAFGSYFQPALIMSAIPFGFMGAAFGHLLLGIDFSIFSFFGIAAAAGVVVNDNLVMVDYVNRLRAEGAGAFAALVEAGTVRFRPIILTSVTTFIGLLPIIFENSLDADFLKPVAISLSFGVFFALFVTLFFVPAMYAVGVDMSRWLMTLWTGEPQPHFGEGASRGELPSIRGSDAGDTDQFDPHPAE